MFDSPVSYIFFIKRLEYMTRMSLYLCTFFNIITYQERQRDWPCEALTTWFEKSKKGVNSNSEKSGEDKSDNRFENFN